MAKLVWRVKLVRELQAGETTEVEVARIERDEQVDLSELGLRLAEAKQLTFALQAAIVPAQVTIAGEHGCTCAACGRRLASKGHYSATFRSLFSDVRRWCTPKAEGMVGCPPLSSLGPPNAAQAQRRSPPPHPQNGV